MGAQVPRRIVMSEAITLVTVELNHESTDPRTDHIPYDITKPIMPAHPSSCTCPDCYEFVFGKEVLKLQ